MESLSQCKKTWPYWAPIYKKGDIQLEERWRAPPLFFGKGKDTWGGGRGEGATPWKSLSLLSMMPVSFSVPVPVSLMLPAPFLEIILMTIFVMDHISVPSAALPGTTGWSISRPMSFSGKQNQNFSLPSDEWQRMLLPYKGTHFYSVGGGTTTHLRLSHQLSKST